MFRCCCSGDLGTWRSGVWSVIVSVAVGGVAVAIPPLLGREPGGDGFAGQWATVTSVFLVPLWIAFGAREGRRRASHPGSGASPHRPDAQRLESPRSTQ